MTVLITLTIAGTDTGPFNLYSDADGFVSAFETGVSKASLLAGYPSSLVPNTATVIRIKSAGTCNNYIDIPLYGTTNTTTSSSSTTTTTSSSTSTTTSSSTSTTTSTTTQEPTTTTTTTVAPITCTAWNNLSGVSAYYDWVDCDGTPHLNEEILDEGTICAQDGSVAFISGGMLTAAGVCGV